MKSSAYWSDYSLVEELQISKGDSNQHKSVTTSVIEPESLRAPNFGFRKVCLNSSVDQLIADKYFARE